MADQEDFPDIYIDESVSTGGVGSEADPYSDFSEINWSATGDNSITDWYAGTETASVTINLKEGEEWREQLTIGASGSAAYPIIIRSYGDDVAPIINGADEETGWSAVADSEAYVQDNDTGTNDEYWFRIITPTTNQPNNGSEIRVEFTASTADSMPITGASIGVRSGSTDDFTTTPTRIKFDSGSNGKTISAGATAWSDWITYDFDTSVEHLVHVHVTTTPTARDKENYLSGTYFKQTAVDETLEQTVTGSSNNAHLYYLSGMETRTVNTYSKAWATSEVVVVEDGDILTWGGSTTTLGVSEFYADGTNLFVRCSDSADPDEHTMQVAARACIIWTLKNYVTMDGIHSKYSKQSGMGITTSTNCIIQNCTITSPRSTGLGTWGGGECAPVSFLNNTLTKVGREGMYFNDDTLTSGTSTISGNTITDTGWDFPGEAEGDAIDVKLRNTGTINITDNTISWAASGMPTMFGRTGIVSQSAVNISGNTISNFYTRGIYVAAGSSVLRNKLSSAVTVTGDLTFIRTAGTTSINYNILSSTATVSGTEIGILFGAEVATVNVYNNCIHRMERGIQADGDVTTSSNMKNNIISEYSGLAYRFTNVLTGVTIDYNCVYTTDGGAKTGRWGVDEETTWADWKTTSGQDGNSINEDPTFTDAANGDFTIQVGSPCINAGTDVGLTTDYTGNIVGALPDIGAYELIGAIATIPPMMSGEYYLTLG